MKSALRETLINALVKVRPEIPRIFYETLDDEALDTEFRTITNSLNQQAIGAY